MSKNRKKEMHRWAMQAYERELYRELKKVDQLFDAWRDGSMSSGELSYRIHQYDKGPSSDLFSRYNDADDEFNVAYALAAGILSEDEVPAWLLEAVEQPLAAFKAMRENGELRLPEA